MTGWVQIQLPKASRKPRGAAANALTAALLLTLGIAGCGTTTPTPSGRLASATSGSSSTASSPLRAGLVDIGGGRKLEMYCYGSGGPAVILEAGLGNAASVWNAVTGPIAAMTTVCAYNRAGIGASDARPEPHGAKPAADDLGGLLAAAQLQPPYVLVGASYGGLVTQLFAREHPTEVAGVVLVDSLATGWDDGLEALLTAKEVADRRAIPNGEPVSNDDIRASERAVGAAPPLPPVPLIVLRHGVPFPAMDADWPTARVEALWQRLQDGLAASSPSSTLVLAAGAGHRIHQDRPDLVIAAVRSVIRREAMPQPSTVPEFASSAPNASLSPEGGLLAFTSSNGLEVARLDGSARRVIVATTDSVPGEPSLDASGVFVAFAMSTAPKPAATGPQPEQPAQVWLADLRANTRRLIVDDGRSPTLRPDGGAVAFVVRGVTYVTTLDGGAPTRVAEGGCPVWSPDGSRLAMCLPDESVAVVDPTGRTPTIAINAPGTPSVPCAWSPDGASLAIASTVAGDQDVFVVPVAGGDPRPVARGAGVQVADAWLPAGLLVTSASPTDDRSVWYLVDPATGSASRIGWLDGVPEPIAAAR